mgnify:CR=1 FL=1
MNISDITNIREQVLAITERLDAMEAEANATLQGSYQMTPEVFEQKLINVFKAGLLAGRKQQYDEIIDCFRYGTKYIDIYAGNLNITGDIEYDDIGVTGTIEDACIEEEWVDCEVDMERIDRALSKFKPEERDTETSES